MRRKDIVPGRWYITDVGVGECVTVEPDITILVKAPYPWPHPLAVSPRGVMREVPEKNREQAVAEFRLAAAAQGWGGGHTHGR